MIIRGTVNFYNGFWEDLNTFSGVCTIAINTGFCQSKGFTRDQVRGLNVEIKLTTVKSSVMLEVTKRFKINGD